MREVITLGSLFDGIGGFPLCAVLSGIEPIWAAEVDASCVALTKQRFPGMRHYGDVSKINGADLPPVDIITLGSPCQDLSVAGKQAGIKNTSKGDGETTRSGLFVEAIRIIYEMRKATHGRYPTFIVWENVPGAFSSNHGHDFQTVLQEITKADIPMPASGKRANAGMVRGGAICAAWRLFDAQYWGVPQRRKRIYLVGSFGSDCAAEILFKPDSVRRYLTPSGAQRADAGRNSDAGAERSQFIFDGRGNGNGQIAPTMTGDHNNRITDYSAIVLQSFGFHGWNSVTAAGVELRKEQAPTLTAKKQADTLVKICGISSTLVAKGPSAVAYSLQGSMFGRKDQNGPNGNGVNKDVCFTLNTVDRHGVAYEMTAENFVHWCVRRLTPKESERLQGYPDDWTVLRKIESMTDEEYEFYKAVYITDKEIKGKAVKRTPTKEQLIAWHNKLDVDGTRYRQLGNSLAIPCALRVIGYIADYIRKGESKK